MDKKYDEPQYIDVDRISPEGIQANDLKEEIKKLCDSQPFAVLATQGKDIIEVVRHLYVNKFQQMREWNPK